MGTGAGSGITDHTAANRVTVEKLGRAFAGKYRIERKLGSGGMGDVFEGRHTALGSSVAIKILSTPLNRDQDLVRRFFREARAAAGLKHPNIINIQDVGQFEDLHYMVMDFVSGQDLKSLINLNPGIDPLRAIDIIAQVARALSYAHSRGIVHRDIKPANIMIDQHGTAVVMDFGIAKVGDATSQLTQEGLLIGTPYYMSPEQCRGEPVTNQSDLYSLGVVFYQLLASRVPFEGHDSLSIIYRKINNVPPPIGELRKDLPGGLDRIVHRLLEREKADRYPNADVLLAELEQLKAELKAQRTRGATPEPRPRSATDASELDRTTPLPGLIPPLPQPDPAHRFQPTTGEDPTGPVEASIVIPGGMDALQPALAETQMDHPSLEVRAPRSSGRWMMVVLFLVVVTAVGVAWFLNARRGAPRPAAENPSASPKTGQAGTSALPPTGNETPEAESSANSPAAGGRVELPPPSKSPTSPSRTAPSKAIAPLTVKAKHRHGIGNCEGTLTISRENVSYQPEEGGKDAFANPYTQLQFNVSGSRLSLKYPDRKYDFDLASGAEVEAAYEKLKRFSAKP
ncbi:MAG: protein kinase [Acidobacteria bacterium]|nr:protein kinase [Acidobacteriota bacterium]